MPDNPHLMDEKNIPSNWQPINASIPSGAPAPPVPHDMPTYFSGSLPPVLQHDASFVATEMGSPRIPKSSLMPFGNQSNPFTNAAAQSTTKIVIQGTAGSSSVSLRIPNIFSPVFQTESNGLLAFNLIPQLANTVLAGPTGTVLDEVDSQATATAITSPLSISAQSHVSDVALVFTAQDNAGSTTFNPGAPWTLVIQPSGAQTVYKQNIVNPTTVTATGAVDLTHPTWASLLALFVAKPGFTPSVVNSHVIQSGAFSSGANLPLSFTPTAGNTLLMVFLSSATNSGSGPASVVAFSDSTSGVWQQIGEVHNNNDHGVQVILLGSSNITGGATTVSFTLDRTLAGTDLVAIELSNVVSAPNLLPGFRLLNPFDIPPINLSRNGVNGGIIGLLGSANLPANVAYTDVANIFTLGQTINAGSGSGLTITAGGNTSKFNNFSQFFVWSNLLTGGLFAPWTNYSMAIAGFSTLPILALAPQVGSTTNTLDIYAPGSTTVKNFAIVSAGQIGNYNGIATVSGGVPAEYAVSDLTAQSAAIAATTLYAVPAGSTGMYRISWSADITTADAVSSVLGGAGGFQVLYTSPTDSVVKTTVAQPDWASNANTTGTAIGGTAVVYAKASTNIQFQFGYTSNTPGQMIYELHIKLEAL